MNRRSFAKGMGAMHIFWYRLTRGRLGGSFMGAPVLLLTTTGRKSGKKRTNPLLYLKDGDDYVVVASNGGRDWDPDWWLNLKHNPNAEVQVRGKKIVVEAEKADAEDRLRLWATVTKMYPQYERYQSRTKREIPTVVLRIKESID